MICWTVRGIYHIRNGYRDMLSIVFFILWFPFDILSKEKAMKTKKKEGMERQGSLKT